MVHERQVVPHEHEEPDAWHRHTAEEGAPQEEHGGRANTAVIALSGLAAIVVIVATAVATIVYFKSYATQLRRERIESTVLAQDYVKYRQAEERKLSSYSWASQDAAKDGTRVSVPLGEAKQRVIARYAQSK